MAGILNDDGAWSRVLRQASLVATTVVATGAAASAAAEVWRRSRRTDGEVRPQRMKRGLTWAEVAKHDRLDDAWLVISGEVYDVTPWLEDHPGGQFLLLAFAGRDATEPFETMGHSAVARKELRRMHVGSLEDSTLAKDALPAARKRAGLERSATLTGGPDFKVEEDVVAVPLWGVESHGFLPTRDPVPVEALIGTPFEPFVDLVDVLPSLGFTGALRSQLDGDPEMQERLLLCGEPGALLGLSDDQIERAFGVVVYVMVAYWRAGTLEYSTGLRGVSGSGDAATKAAPGGSCAIGNVTDRMPAFLARPVMALSRHVGRPPMIDYASSVLYNWTRINKDGPITMSNVRCVLRLTGLIDEEWFMKTHVVIESESSHVISAVIAASRTDDETELLTQLVALEEALWRVVRACLPIMYERSDDGTPKCCEHIFYQILRPLIKSGLLTFEGEGSNEPLFLHGPSGAMSSLLPCVDAALGIETSSEKLREAMAKFKLSMPVKHQQFIDELVGTPNIRKRILVSRPVGESSDSEHYDALVRAFNRVISRVLDFRWQHWQYIKNFVMKPGNISHAVGTGGTSFDYLQQHITDTEKARLTERQDGALRVVTPGVPMWASTHVPPMANHPSLEYWSVDGKRGLLAREPLVIPSKASWAVGLPAPMLAACEEVWSLALKLPALCAANGPYYELVARSAERLAPLQDDRVLIGMSEVAREHLMTTMCHIAAGCISTGHKKPPPCIEKPLRVVARSVGRPPRLDFTEIVLSNWDATYPSGDRPASSTGQGVEQAEVDTQQSPQMHVVWRFLGTPDEEWYRAIHIVMHDEARDVVSAIRVGHVAMRDHSDGSVVNSLEQISSWLNKFCDYFDEHFEVKDSRTEGVMIRRLEPFLSHGRFSELGWEEQRGSRKTDKENDISGNSFGMLPVETAAWVYCCGSSVLLPAIHAFLGVEQCPREAHDGAGGDRIAQVVRRILDEGRVFMPRSHLAFLESLEKPGVSIRQYCFRRFGAKMVSVEALHDLEVAYNDALNALGRYVSRRVHLVSRFFPMFKSSFGALHSEYETHMRVERLQLLKMRQRVSRGLER